MKIEETRRKALIFKALAHPARIIILESLQKKDRCVCEFLPILKVHQSVVSRHLSCLKNAGIVSEKKRGVKVFYHLETPCIIDALRCALKAAKEDIRKKAASLR